MNATDILDPTKRDPSKAYLVNKLRVAVHSWRDQHYPGTTETTKRLLQFWFGNDHVIGETQFEFWFCQREAIETLVYVYEVLKKKKLIELSEEFGEKYLPTISKEILYNRYPNYAFKMATGSGKTFVMAFAIVWSFLNCLKENKIEYTSKFLLIAPNIIVYERLKRDFEDGKIFFEYPFIPDEWREDFQLKIVLREDPLAGAPDNAVFLTNIHQLQERQKDPSEVDELLGLEEEVQQGELQDEGRIVQVLQTSPNLMILKDEAHHIYHLEKVWKKILLNLDDSLRSTFGTGINMELDYSATPKTETGALFPWIVVDFSLKEAVQMEILKRPLKGKVGRAKEISSTKPHERFRAWIDAGVRRWREYKKLLAKLNKRPVLFIMCEDTKSADDIYAYMNSLPDLQGKVLLIHTNLEGEVTGGASESLAKIPERGLIAHVREIARNIDEPNPDENPYEVIVSVLMLNEGWDVRNVTIVVGLRSYTSKRRILPEQVIGRGLRKMFPDQPSGNAKNLVNMLEVIGPPALTDILERLEKEENIRFDEVDTAGNVEIVTVFPLDDRKKLDFEFPMLTPRIAKKDLDIDRIKLSDFKRGGFELGNRVIRTPYIAQDMIDKVVVIEKEWNLPVPKDSRSVIGYYAQKILKELKIPAGANFNVLYPLVKSYVEERLFSKKIDLDDPRVLFILSEAATEEFIVSLFTGNLRKLTFREHNPKVAENRAIMQTKPFPWSRQVYSATKSVFNYIPCENQLELQFARFLDHASDVVSFCKNERVGLLFEYKSAEGQLRLYKPDFLVKLKKGERYIVETKGLVDVEVPQKDARAEKWVKDASNLTDENWSYVRVNQEIFYERAYSKFSELVKAIKAPRI